MGDKMFFKSIVISLLMLIGAGAVYSGSIVNRHQTSQSFTSTYIVYQWIGGVRWAFVYAEDGTLIAEYPDPN
jgi:hypothetical protein